MVYRTITVERREHITFITLNRPGEGNWLGEEIAAELGQACQDISQDEQVWVVVVGGAGQDFCSGGDGEGAIGVEAVASLELPVIGALQGDVLGLGLALALSCDLRVAASEARLGVPSFPPHPAGLTQRLPRLIGRSKAQEMLLLGETYPAPEALRMGLVHRVVPAAELAQTSLGWARQMAARSPIAARLAKEAVLKGMDLSLAQGLRLEADLYFLLHTTSDRTEGITAFLHKRPPQFRGE